MIIVVASDRGGTGNTTAVDADHIVGGNMTILPSRFQEEKGRNEGQ